MDDSNKTAENICIYFKFYDELIEPFKTQAKENYDPVYARAHHTPISAGQALSQGFDWGKTTQKYLYWSMCHIHIPTMKVSLSEQVI